MVEEVLLELVEDERGALRPSHLVESRAHIVAPGVEQDDDPVRLEVTQPAHDSGAQERRLADAAVSVEDGDPLGDDVRDDQFAFELTPEEEQRVELGVVECAQALEG